MVDTGVLLDRAAFLLERGRIREAEVAARGVLSKEPYNDEALALLGRCAFEGRHFEDGMGFIREALSLRPEHSFYYYLLAFGHYQLGEQEAAISHLETAQAFHPHIAEYFGLHAFVLLAQNEWQAALHKAGEGLVQEADNLTCLNARSRALSKLRRTGEAIEASQDALALDPHNELTHTTVAWNYLERGSHKAAQRHFSEALRLNPNSEGAREGLKEALKSGVAPYRWLLQYQYWLQHRGRKWQRAAPLVIYVLFKVFEALLGANAATKGLVWIPVSLYAAVVITSWTIAPIANFVLLFHRVGKYAITASERYTALTVVTALALGLIVLASGESAESRGFLIALTLIFMTMPLGAVTYPLRWKGAHLRTRAAMALSFLGMLSVVALLVAAQGLPALTLFGLFMIGTFLFSWTAVFR